MSESLNKIKSKSVNEATSTSSTSEQSFDSTNLLDTNPSVTQSYENTVSNKIQ